MSSYYRLMGIYYYDDNGRPRFLYKIYCAGMFLLHLFLMLNLTWMYLTSNYFTSKSTIQSSPIIINHILRITHVLVSSGCILRSNKFMTDFHNSISCIQNGVERVERPFGFHKYHYRALHLLQLFLVVTVSSCYIVETGRSFEEKFIFFVLLMFDYLTYIKEDWLILCMLMIRDTLLSVNNAFQSYPVSSDSIKSFRKIHSKICVLNSQVNEHFGFLVTTWTAASTMIIWGHLFRIIQTLMSSVSSSKYLFIVSVVDTTHHLLKVMTVCHYCEAVKEEVHSKNVQIFCLFGFH